MATVTNGLATSFIQFSRPSASGGGATVTDRDGKIKWAGHNLLLASESFDSSSWSRSGMTGVTANSTAALNSTTTADTAVESNTLADHWLSQTASMPAGSTVTLSVYVKRGSGTRNLYLRCLAQGGSDLIAAYYNLGTGAVGSTVNGGTGVISSTTITDAGSGWYFCTLSGVFSTSNALSSVAVGIANATTVGSHYFTGDGTSSLILWGAHLYRSDLGSMQQNPAMPAGMGSYYPTTPRNLLGFTEDIGNGAGWSKDATVTSNTEVAPNGLQTADTISGGVGTYVTQTVSGLNIATPHTVSVYLKANTANVVRLYVYKFPGGQSGSVDFNLTTGTYGTVAGLFAPTSPAITVVGNGWYRCSFRTTFDAGTGMGVALYNQSAATGSYYLWGAQLSDSASLDAYSPQYGAAVTSAAYYAPRLDFDSSGVAKGLLVEEARTNLVKYSNDFSVADWEGGVTRALQVTNNNAVSPDGGTTAAKVYEAAAGAGSVLQRILQSVSGTAQVRTISVYAKKAERKRIVIGENANDTYAWFDLDLGTCAIASGSAAGTPSITPVGNGWYRCVLTPTTSFGSATVQIHIITDAATSSTARVGDGASGVYLYGAQVDSVTGASASFVTSYVPTGSATATRAADVASVSTQAFPYSASEGTIVVSVANVQSAGAAPTFVSFDDGNGGYDNAREIYLQGANGDIIAYEASSNVAAVNSVVIYNGSAGAAFTGKVAYAYKANDFDASYNGNAAASLSTSGTPAANISRMGIGTNFPANANGATGGQAHIRQITYLPRKLTDAELAARSA